ncbi:hypothetical protein [Prosthecomicrobium pneumaticum]|uniref:Uncharacterized protein n=1 Tax=Prosthecomicrobium pneumaticum TaxID=81895 RepID=A0A7W9CW32_9HYPH|nr:hypothetical protein [Prosthecomicrobium pneumaticum]MBB5752641.1 hypothetical protein [Prosthecomicrobium pneumaticum]
MTDYYAVLKKAIAGLERNTGETRRAVYDKARNALIGQLKAIDPPLTTSEISRQRLELEEAIRKVEREVTVTSVGPQPARVRATAAVAEALAEPIDVPPPQQRRAAPPPVADEPAMPPRPPMRAQPAPPAPRSQPAPPPPVVEPSASWAMPEPVPAAPPPRREPEPPQRMAMPPVPEVSPVRGEAVGRQEPVMRAEPSLRQDPNLRQEPSLRQEPTLGPLDDDPALAPSYGAEPDWSEPLGEPEETPRAARRERRPREARPPARRAAAAPRRRLPLGLSLGLLVVIALGAGAYVLSQRGIFRDVIGDMISSIESSQPAPALSEQGAPSAGDTGAAPAKNDDRLGDAAPAPSQARPVRTVDPATDSGETDPLAQDDSIASATPPADTSPAPAPSADDAGGALVAQKAILYEQPTAAGAGVQAIDARVTWRFNADSPNGPEVQAIVDVPNRSMKVTVNIRKNTDQALPASHLVEIIVDTPSDFAAGGVKSVPAFVMKPTEAARGTPLDGAAAKVADGFFWIAFSNDERLMSQNVALMRERDWIDLPIVYENDQRAILTFEKGSPGQRAFEQALAAWG